MNKQASFGLSSIIILITVFLIATTAASVLISSMKNTGNPGSENDLNRMTQEAVSEISTYIQIKEIYGKYSVVENQQKIQSLAILIKPLFSTEIDLSEALIEISNGQDLRFLSFSGQTENIQSYSLFEHPIWNVMSSERFSVVTIFDTDNSIIHFNTINDQTDTSFLLLTLPEELAMKKGDSLKITLLPATGVMRTIQVTAPLPMQTIVSLLD